MIVLNVTYKCKPGMNKAFLAKLNEEGLGAACRAEDGNIKYHYYLPTDGSDELLLVEKWRDKAALKAHAAQPHFARIGAVKAEFVDDTVIEKFFVEE